MAYSSGAIDRSIESLNAMFGEDVTEQQIQTIMARDGVDYADARTHRATLNLDSAAETCAARPEWPEWSDAEREAFILAWLREMALPGIANLIADSYLAYEAGITLAEYKARQARGVTDDG